MTAHESHWSAYINAQVGRQPRPLCVEVLAHAGQGDGQLAIDLGCGGGIESRALLEQGWRVLAIDSEPSMPGHLQRLAGDDSRLETQVAALQDVALPAAELVYAGYALPFLSPADFRVVWGRILHALRPHAWLAVDLFGDRDGWAGTAGMTFHTRPEAEAAFDGLTIVSLDEEDADRPAFTGPKHWHVFHVIAQRA